MTIMKITKEEYPNIWNSIIEEEYCEVPREHRRGSNFYVVSVYKNNVPTHPHLWDYWKSECYIHDTEWGGDADTLHRVEKKTVTRTVTEDTWITPTPNPHDELIEKFKKGIYNVRYIKADGSERSALATLLPSLLKNQSGANEEYISRNATSRRKNEQLVPYFDIKIGEFRSFRIDRLQSCEEVKV